MCCLYFGSSRERFALLQSPRMIKTDSGCFCSVFMIRSFPVAQLVEHGASNAKIMGSIPRESKS